MVTGVTKPETDRGRRDFMRLYYDERYGDKDKCAKEAGISDWRARKIIHEVEAGKQAVANRPRNGTEYAEQKASPVVGPIPRKRLSHAAKRALEDFAFFRRRYFGRVSTPWQEEAGYLVLELMESRRKEFAVINAPPGSGKSTLFTHDIPAWLTIRQRGIRGMMGSASQPLAQRYLRRLMATFEAGAPLKAADEDLRMGVGFDAVATLAGDYGLLKPPNARPWSVNQLLVLQDPTKMAGEKEPTWSAVGIESTYIGGRYDICLWDDTVDPRAVLSLKEVETVQSDWDKVAEKRLEPSGLLVLQGQRLGPADLYRYNLDKVVGEEQEEPHGEKGCRAEPGRKYHHIVYRAHDENLCQGEHAEDSPPWPEGCLLDPRRLTWRELSAEMANDEGNYLQVYQQEDANPDETLVNRLWVKGGVDPVSREYYPGCWDVDRSIGEMPLFEGRVTSVASTDPSGGKSWASEWWVYDEKNDLRYLIDLDRSQMQADQFLGLDFSTGEFTGLAHRWMLRSRELGRPITHWIMEWNAAQRYLIQNSIAKRWSARYNVTFIAHDTHKNRSDKRLGVEALLRPIYKYGKVRLPGASDLNTRAITMKLVDEVTKWRGDGRGYRNDTVMSEWFFEHNLERLKRAGSSVPPLGESPSWLQRAI